MEFIQSTISLIITLGILVTIHEYGHFWVARRCGVKVLKFSVGFGNSLFSWHDKHGTEFAVAAIPLGGYVKMLDEREAPVAEHELDRAFNRKPVSQRIAIAAAGPIANFLFAIFAYWVMFLYGFNAIAPIIGAVEADSISEKSGIQSQYEITAVDERSVSGWRDVNLALINRVGETGNIVVEAKPYTNAPSERFELAIVDWFLNEEPGDLIGDLGLSPFRPAVPAIVDEVVQGSPADVGGLIKGDVVEAANNAPVDDWFGLVEIIQKSAGKEISLLVRRDSQLVDLRVTPERIVNENGSEQGRLGVRVAPIEYPEEMIRTVRLGPVDALAQATISTWEDTEMTLVAIKKMVVGLISLENLSGPITIAQVASASISSGFEDFLRFLALISVSLGVLNLLPIPVLDGGHILYYTLEAIRGKPISEEWQLIGLKIGISFVLIMMTVAFYNDVMRL